jgi:hypothetical protein
MSSAHLTTNLPFPNYSSFSAAAEHEPLEAAMLEIGRRGSALEISREQLHARLEQLRSNKQELRRRRSRSFALSLSTPVSFYSIEEAVSE